MKKPLALGIRVPLSPLLVAGTIVLLTPQFAVAAPCRETPNVPKSANASDNTAMGGHLTQHIYGMAPPAGASQEGKTLFSAQGKYQDVWRQYQYIANPVNCAGSGQAQQSVSLETLGIKNLDAYSCKEVNAEKQCIRWDAYIAKSVFFGFILKNGTWLLNTAFPEPLK